MKLIMGGRGSGRTTNLIKESAKTGATIACYNSGVALDIRYRAILLELNIPTPITFSDLIAHRCGLNATAILIDDAETFIQCVVGARVDSIVITDRAEPIFESKEFNEPRYRSALEDEARNQCKMQRWL